MKERRPARLPLSLVKDLRHDAVLGWDFLSKNKVLINCSPDQEVRFKLRIKKPVSVPPYSAVCLTVRVDQELSCDEEYLFVGQRSANVEVCDSLIKPFSATEIPIYVRNRSDRTITLHRRSVIGYVEDVGSVEPCEPCPSEVADDPAVYVNAISSDDGRYIGKATDEILSEFVVGGCIGVSQRDKLAALLSSFPELFSRGYSDIGFYRETDVDLELQPGARPVFTRPYHIPWARETQLKAQLDELKGCGVVEEGGPSDWNSPIILVSKGTGEFRITQDMRNLNKLLVPKTFVFPNIDDFIFSLGGWKIASSLDIRHAFWNLRLSKKSSDICSFHALGKTYYPTRMPMGCSQSSYFLHVAMRKVLGDVPGVRVYADDILCVSESVDEHFRLLHTVLDRLREAGLKVAPDKCHLFQTELTYLGHRITPEGITIDPQRVSVVRELSPPRTIKAAKRVFGFFSWFRKLIPSFSTLAEPLVVLCNSDRFYWDEVLEKCFDSLKSEILSYPRRDCPFILYTYSSTTGAGQILTQIQDGVERVIAFNGSRYSKAQRKWTIYELEVFSFIQGLKKFFKYVADVQFKWVCDCRGALQLLRNKDHIHPRIVRWRAFVSQFQYTTEHRKANQMQHVDMLSRLHADNEADSRQRPESGEARGPGCETEPCVSPLPRRSRSSGANVPTGAGGLERGSAAVIADRRPPASGSSVLSAPGRLQTADGGDPGAQLHSCQSERSDLDPAGVRRTDITDSDAPPNGNDPQSPNIERKERADLGETNRGSASRCGDAQFSRNGREGAREVNVTAADRFVQLPLKPDALGWYQRHDRNCRAIAHCLNHGKWPRYAPPSLKRQPADTFRLNDGIVFRVSGEDTDNWQVVWPLAKRYE